jgi:L-alanine-DL-glutamate epimerase-like enolase superfamily enzyme
VRITDVEAIVVGEPLAGFDATAWDGSQETVIIRVSTDAGITGIGEVDSGPEVIRAIVESPASHKSANGLRLLCLGEDPREIGRLWHKCLRGTAYFGPGGAPVQAISGLEIALWDIAGKVAGVPVSTLLGGAHRSHVPVYASTLTPSSPEETAELVRTVAAQGFRAIKLGAGPLGTDPDYDVELVAAARAAAPAGMAIMIDVAMAWETTNHALRMAKRLERYDLAFIEEPIWPDDIDAYAWLSRQSPVPIAAGEAESGEDRLLEMIQKRAVHVLQPDITRMGGLLAARRVIQAAERAGQEVICHCWSTGIIKAASLHVTAASSHLRMLEYCVEDNPVQRSLVDQAFPVVDGQVAVPTGPGLGIAINEKTLNRHVRKSEVPA